MIQVHFADIAAAGSIHVFFEGYFVFNNGRMASMKDFFGQLWKEYALSDSRYMSSDPLVLVMESLTMVRILMPPEQLSR
jgi:cholestenol delta-isomerase